MDVMVKMYQNKSDNFRMAEYVSNNLYCAFFGVDKCDCTAQDMY